MAVKDKTNAGSKRSGKFKIILIIIILLILLIGGAISFWWFQLREPGVPVRSGGGVTSVTTQENPADAVRNAPATDIPRPVVNNVALPTVMVNLADAAGDRYLKVGMEVEVTSPDAAQEIQAQTAKIRDAVIILLSSKTYAELSTTDGKMQLKNEVASRLNQILGTPRVVRIYFTEFVVQ